MSEGKGTGRRRWMLFGLPLLMVLAFAASGCFVLGGRLFVRGSDSVFVGMARNALTNVQAVDTDVEVKFYDGDTLLSTKTVRICTRTLQSDDGKAEAPFEAVLKNNKKADRVETRVLVRLPLGKKIVPDLEYQSVNVAWVGSNFVITGEVFNDDTQDFEDVVVCAAVLDDDGNVLRVGSDQVGDIDENKKAAFEITVPRDSAAETVKLWVDAERTSGDVTRPVTRTATVPSKTATPTSTPTATATATPTASAAISGTAGDGATESQIVTGGQDITITLTDTTWVAAGAAFDSVRDDIINGLTSAQSEATGWNNQVKGTLLLNLGSVVRASDTVVTITLPPVANYSITADETVTVTVPASATEAGVAITGSPTITITNE